MIKFNDEVEFKQEFNCFNWIELPVDWMDWSIFVLGKWMLLTADWLSEYWVWVTCGCGVSDTAALGTTCMYIIIPMHPCLCVVYFT